VTARARFARAASLSALVALVAAPNVAAAEFGPISLVSKGPAQQAGEAKATALSGDGRYLAFQGIVGPVAGIFREDLSTGAIVPVATGGAAEGGASASAVAPSISADGRYVGFTTGARLDPDDDLQPGSADVYVADTSSSPPSYELASALDGCDPETAGAHTACGLTYSGGGGSAASGRVALSADGRQVAFFTTADSNLTEGPAGSTPGVPTPAWQVVLRDLDSDRTTLVSVERDPETGAMTDRPVAGGGMISSGSLEVLRGATLSADGSTVAWIGTHLPAQVPMAAAEAETISHLDTTPAVYDEPLWRRVASGAQAPTRRVVAGDGAADPFPNLIKKNDNLNSAEGWIGVKVDGVPRLSADGRTVVLIGNPTEATNLFTVDMGAGLSRAQAVHQLTREVVVNQADPGRGVNEEAFVPLNGHVYDLAISPDARRIVFASARQRYPLSPPNLVGSPPSSLGLVELYTVDLDSETLQRVTHGFGGVAEPSLAKTGKAANGFGASSPSLGGAGLIAFASTASNLVAGDGNEASDAFLVAEEGTPAGSGTLALSAGPPAPKWKQAWRLTLSAFSLPDGSVRLVAVVPAAGRLLAGIGAEVGDAKRPRKLPARRAWALKSGSVPIELHLPRRYQHLARGKGGLFATARVSFRRKGRKTLRGKLQVRFHVHPAKAKRG
jgi:Tol biopolymer transport system component